MTKFIVLFALLGVGIIALTSQTAEAKPFLKPSFFVLTTRVPLNGQSSGFGGEFDLTNLIMPKIRLLLNLLQNATAKKSSLLGGGLLGGSVTSSVKPTTSKIPDFDTSFEPESTTKYTSSVPAKTEASVTDLSSNTDDKVDIDIRTDTDRKNVVKNDDVLSPSSDKMDDPKTTQNNEHIDSNSNAQPSHGSDNEDGYSYKQHIETNEIPVEPIKANKYLPPAQ